MKLVSASFIFCFSFILSYGQIKQGTVIVGGSKVDVAEQAVVTRDGGYAMAGYTTSFGYSNTSAYLVKLDSLFNLKWTKVIGGSSVLAGWGFTDIANSLIQTNDGGFAMAGWTSSYGLTSTYGGDEYIIKTDSIGTIEWTKTIGGNANDVANKIIQTSDGGFAVIGGSNSFGRGSYKEWWSYNVYVIKLDSKGIVKWNETITGSSWSAGYDIIQTNDKGFAITGYAVTSPGDSDVYIVKLDSTGNIKWTKTIGGSGDDEGYSIAQSNDEGYMVAGYTNSYGAGNYDIYVIKLDSAGNVKWTETIGGKDDDGGESIIQDKNNGCIITGWTDSYGAGGYDVYVIKLDSMGKIKQTRTIGGAADEQGVSIVLNTNKGYCISGLSDSYSPNNEKMYLVVLDSMLNNCNVSGSGGIISSIDSGKIGNAGIITSKPSGYLSNGGIVDSGGTDSIVCVVYEPPKIAVITSPSCSGCTGTALVNLTGYNSSHYTYLWSNGDTNNYLTGLCTGKYVLYIMNNGDTITTDTVFIPSTTNPSVNIPSASIVDVKCYNGNNGSATAIASGGKPPYSYAWYPVNQTTVSAYNLKAGTYTVITKDSNGCAGINTVTITQPALLTINTSPDISITAGQTTTITAAASGGTIPYVYSWSNNTSGTNDVVSPITKTTYTIVVTDSNGCQANAFIAVDVTCGDLFIPEAFSPNNDGKNDVLYVRDYCIKEMDFVIFDRWGNKIFESENISEGWDGTYKGKPVNTGDFVYYLNATMLDGSNVQRKGNITLVR